MVDFFIGTFCISRLSAKILLPIYLISMGGWRLVLGDQDHQKWNGMVHLKKIISFWFFFSPDAWYYQFFEDNLKLSSKNFFSFRPAASKVHRVLFNDICRRQIVCSQPLKVHICPISNDDTQPLCLENAIIQIQMQRWSVQIKNLANSPR